MSSPATSATPARASRWWRGLGEARARRSCLKLEEEEQVGEDLGETPCSKEEDEVEVVQLVGVDLRRPPTMLRRGEGFNGGGGAGEAPPRLW